MRYGAWCLVLMLAACGKKDDDKTDSADADADADADSDADSDSDSDSDSATEDDTEPATEGPVVTVRIVNAAPGDVNYAVFIDEVAADGGGSFAYTDLFSVEVTAGTHNFAVFDGTTEVYGAELAVAGADSTLIFGGTAADPQWILQPDEWQPAPADGNLLRVAMAAPDGGVEVYATDEVGDSSFGTLDSGEVSDPGGLLVGAGQVTLSFGDIDDPALRFTTEWISDGDQAWAILAGDPYAKTGTDGAGQLLLLSADGDVKVIEQDPVVVLVNGVVGGGELKLESEALLVSASGLGDSHRLWLRPESDPVDITTSLVGGGLSNTQTLYGPFYSGEANLFLIGGDTTDELSFIKTEEVMVPDAEGRVRVANLILDQGQVDIGFWNGSLFKVPADFGSLSSYQISDGAGEAVSVGELTLALADPDVEAPAFLFDPLTIEAGDTWFLGFTGTTADPRMISVETSGKDWIVEVEAPIAP